MGVLTIQEQQYTPECGSQEMQFVIFDKMMFT